MANDSILMKEGNGLFVNDTGLESAIQNACPNISQEQRDQHYELQDIFSWWFEGIGLVFVACYGVLLNSISISILRTKELQKSFFNLLLVWLSIFDTLYVLSHPSV